MRTRIKAPTLIAATAAITFACSESPTTPVEDSALLTAVAESEAPPLGSVDITPGTILNGDGVEMNAIAVQIIGSNDSAQHNAVRVVAWIASEDGERPFAEMMRAGVRTRGSAEPPIGVTVAIEQFMRGVDQQAFAFYAAPANGGRWRGTEGGFTVDVVNFTGAAEACDLPEEIDIDCTVETGQISGSFDFVAQLFGNGGDTYTQPLTTFDLPALRITVNGSLDWRGMRHGRGQGKGWGFGG